MKRLALGLLLLLAPLSLPAQRVISPTVWIEPAVLQLFNQDWIDTPGQNERAYCLRFVSRTQMNGMMEYTVVEAWRAGETNPTPNSIGDTQCPKGKDISEMHTHPPHTNLDDVYPPDGVRKPSTFIAGGIEAYFCQPSDTDYTTLLFKSDYPFELIMCAKNALAPYFRKSYKIIGKLP